MSQVDPTFLSDDEWQWATSHLPIACVDIVPVQHTEDRKSTRVGLIRRRFADVSNERIVWCHLGGRINLDEVLIDAANRHLDETLAPTNGVFIDPKSYTVAEFLRHPHHGTGYDPSKHAVSTVLVAEYPPGVMPHPLGEALAFQWFDLDNLPSSEDFWPGSYELIRNALRGRPWKHFELSYQAVSASCVSHNDLMWQTPVLAMTAMAFLLTVALGDEGAYWSRALAGGLSAVTAFASMQLMAKHSHYQLRDTDRLLNLEIENGMEPLHARPTITRVPWHQALKDPVKWLVSLRSRHIWLFSLLLFGIASAAIAIFELLAGG